MQYRSRVGGCVLAALTHLAGCGDEPATETPADTAVSDAIIGDANMDTAVSDAAIVSDAAPPPAWLADKPLNEWFQIPGTAGAGGTAVYAYSGMALKPSTSEILVALAGGHGDSSDNRVSSIRLDQDKPTWTIRMPASKTVEPNVPYYSDGKPSARHTYYTLHYVAQVDRLMVIGAQFVYGTPPSFPKVDGFNLETNTWDPAGTWPDLATGGGYGKALNAATGDVWTAAGYTISRWSAAEKRQTVLKEFNSLFMAMQNAWDPVRNQLVSMGFGDGWGYGNFPALNAYTIDAAGKTATEIKFAPSAGLTQFLADRPVSASFEYDPDNDRFLYFDARGDGEYGPTDDGGRIFVITPHATAPWDVSILPLGAGTKNPARSTTTGIYNRFRYVPAFKGFVYLAMPSYNDAPDLYFIRTAK